jgi:hypothetical protein
MNDDFFPAKNKQIMVGRPWPPRLAGTEARPTLICETYIWDAIIDDIYQEPQALFFYDDYISIL